MKSNNILNVFFGGSSKASDAAIQLAANAKTDSKTNRVLPWKLKAVSRVRQDVKMWNAALNQAQSDEPKNYALQLLYSEIMLDALLTSQIENRIQATLSSKFSLKTKTGEVDEEQTDWLKNNLYRKMTRIVLESNYYGYNLPQLSLAKDMKGNVIVNVEATPRTNVVPQTGLFYADYSEDKTIPYRDMREFGTYILEFYTGELGLLNKAVNHVLFKRFAQSCWSELCEIYGIPPRVMKTNTQDPTSLSRAEQMMKDMGAAAWFIIDETESFEWAKGTDTNGDVYNNLIALCNNELSMLVSGAVIGQDTKNGNRSKEESSQDMLWNLVEADKQLSEENWNKIIIPALLNLGVLKGDVHLEYEATEDLEQLWKITKDALQYFTVKPDWVKDKFGVEITGERQQNSTQNQLSFGADFFV